MNWYSVEKNNDFECASKGSYDQEVEKKHYFESDLVGSSDQEIFRMVGIQRSDLSTERPKRFIDIKNSVRCRERIQCMQ